MDATLRILALLAAAAAPAAAQTLEEVRWSRGEGLWTDAGGWSPEVVPNNTPEAHYHAIVPTGRTVEIPPSERIEITRLSGGGTVVAGGRSFQIAEWEGSGKVIVRDGDFVAGVVRPTGTATLSLERSGRATRIERIEPESNAELFVSMGPAGRLVITESDNARLRVNGAGDSLGLLRGLSADSAVDGVFTYLAIGGTSSGSISVRVSSVSAVADFTNPGSATLVFDTTLPSSGSFAHVENSGTLMLATTPDGWRHAPVSMAGLVNTGRVVLTGDVSATTLGHENGVITNSGLLEISSTPPANAGLSADTVINHGTIRVGVRGGLFTLSGPIINAGRIEVAVGLPPEHPGPRGGYVFSNAFEQTSEGELRIVFAGSDTSAADPSETIGVYVNGPTSLAGTLAIDILPPFSPAPGDEFFVLKTRSGTPLADLIQGAFDRLQLPPLHGAAWNADALYTEGVLRVVEACGAEWDGQPGVDVGDLLAFLADFRDGAPGADVTGDGRTDVADLLTFLGSFRAGC